MGSLTTQVETELELAILALVNRAAFGRAVQRVAWRDGSVDWAPPSVVVKASGLREDPIAPLYVCRVSLTAYTYAPDDESQSVLNAIHGDLEALATTLTPASLTALASNITIHGIDILDGQDSAGDDLQGQSVELDVWLQAEFSALTTTTSTTTTT